MNEDVKARSCSCAAHPPSDRKTRASKIPARRAEYSLTENFASPFQAEPRQLNNGLLMPTWQLGDIHLSRSTFVIVLFLCVSPSTVGSYF